MSALGGLCIKLVDCHDSLKGILAGMRGLSDFETYFSTCMNYSVVFKEEKRRPHPSHILGG